MLFVLSGPSYVGKKSSIAHFMKLYSFSSIIPYTTKPGAHRTGETEGIQYHYVDEKSRMDIENSEYIYMMSHLILINIMKRHCMHIKKVILKMQYRAIRIL